MVFQPFFQSLARSLQRRSPEKLRGKLGTIVTLSFTLSLLSLSFAAAPLHSQTQPEQSSTPGAGSPQPLLKQGSQGAAVSELQAMLKLLGYYTGTVDGVYQDSTANAVVAFQRSAGLQADGIVGSDTWLRLLPPAPAAAAAAPAASPAPSPTPAASPTPTSSPTPAASSRASAPADAANPNSFPSPTASPAAPRDAASFPSPTPTPSPTPAASPALNPAPSPAPNPTPAASPAPSSSPAAAPAAAQPSTAAASTTADFPILRAGMRGTAVSGLQERLRAIGLFNGAIDGVFGTETQEAVKAAQRNFNLEADGVVGPATWIALMR